MKEYEKQNLETARHYGYEAQSNQLIEEMAELTQAINKHKRVLGIGQKTDMNISQSIENIIEEIADVELMISQIKFLLGINDCYVEGVKQEKVRRTRKRIERGERL